VKKLIILKKKTKKIFFFKKIKINIKNFVTKPENGGIPAIENNVKMTVIKKNCRLPKLFNSFKVLKNLKSNIKIKLNIENNKVIYTIIFNKTILKPYSWKKFSKFIII
jgi:hypothetical protein